MSKETVAAAAQTAPTPERKDWIKQYRAARMAGAPIVAIQTIDALQTMAAIMANSNPKTPFISWNTVEGWKGMNKPGTEAIQEALTKAEAEIIQTRDPIDNFTIAKCLPIGNKTGTPPGSVLFVQSAHRWLDGSQGVNGADYAQAVFNLRDDFKASMRTVVLLGPQFIFPAELAQHVYVIDEPLPDAAEIRDSVSKTMGLAGLSADAETLEQATLALRGVGYFSLEQATAMAVSKEGLNLQDLWARKRRMVAATPGLSIWAGTERFSDIGGCEQIKSFMQMILAGRRKPRVIVFVDEIEKAFAGATGGTSDSSGVSQGFLGTVLSEMQDRKHSGAIFVGPPGAAKSALAKAAGTEAGIPTIVVDLTGMKDSLVGSSEARLRAALKVIHAVGEGDAFWIATCNKIQGLPPELKRRFKMGTWFFDLPTAEERKQIWEIYIQKFHLDAEQVKELPEDTDWTGAEIENCCDVADRTGQPLIWAAQFIVPVARANREAIIQLRNEAAGRYNSAAYPGPYRLVAEPKPLEITAPGERLMASEASV